MGFVCAELWRWRQVVLPFLAQGLARGERCVYLATLHTPWLLPNLLAWQGMDLARAEARGQFLISNAARHYLHRGGLDPQRVLDRNAVSVRLALREGFTGLRTVSDMSWAVHYLDEWDRLEQYEARLEGEYFSCLPATAICFYDQGLFPRALRQMVERTHPLMIDNLGLPRRTRHVAGLD